MIDWPPHYTIRHSKRAKGISLRLYSGSGLEIVVPERRRSRDVLAFLNEHRAWVEKQAAKLKMSLAASNDPVLPDHIELRALNHMIDVIYYPITAASSVSCRFSNHKMIFYGAIHDISFCVTKIIAWLKKQAKQYLSDWIRELSVSCNLPYRQLSIRGQKTVWGSCTSDKDIQLNYKILFLPPVLARYVLIHELCHTVHMNHSKSFWKLVAKYEPNFHIRVKELREANQYIPTWLSRFNKHT